MAILDQQQMQQVLAIVGAALGDYDQKIINRPSRTEVLLENGQAWATMVCALVGGGHYSPADAVKAVVEIVAHIKLEMETNSIAERVAQLRVELNRPDPNAGAVSNTAGPALGLVN